MTREALLMDMKMRHSGSFVISLDFELYWGLRHGCDLEECCERILGARKAVEFMLDLFPQHGVAATWATVGMLLFDDRKNLLSSLPSRKPRYENRQLSPYDELEAVGKNEEDDPLHYALSLVSKILATPRQELASHTFSRYCAFEPGQTRADFAEDLAATKRAAGRLGIEMHSLLSQWNQYSPEYLAVCRDEESTVVRSDPGSWLYTKSTISEDNVSRRIWRLTDTYMPLTNDMAPPVHEPINGIVAVPASRYLRSVNGKTRIFKHHRLSGIEKSMTAAARSGCLFHLWWHPHNFGINRQDNLDLLRRIMDHYSLLKDAQNFRSLSMGEAAQNHVATCRPRAA